MSPEHPALKYHQYVSEYLTRADDVVSHAARLYSAGQPESVFAVDESEPSTVEKIAFLPFFLVGARNRKKSNPGAPAFKQASTGRNKLIIFRSWLVRCTYQQFSHERNAELFYYSGIPLKDIKSVDISNDSLSIYGDGGNLGGHMSISPPERGVIVSAFNRLSQENRLHKEARVSSV
jgi:hypothetical protein